eukprot:m.340699 g.340699  ORF g.340699 m.340699 type:complete len:405 (-) comp20598_c0_seq4:204-1418(-)
MNTLSSVFQPVGVVLLLFCSTEGLVKHRGRSTTANISNALPRRTADGKIVNAHSGNIVKIESTYFLYGENYGLNHYTVQGTNVIPKLAVYSSEDMTTWKWHGFLHNNTSPGWAESGKWPDAPQGEFWSPWAIYDRVHKRVVLWFSATPANCCDAYFGVATSNDGIHFELVTLNGSASVPGSVDGSALLIDDDGAGYVAYTVMNAPGQRDHVVAIDRLSPDFLSTSGKQMGTIFPDYFVEGVMLFKRKQWYYVVYGSCCCACAAGSGAVVYASRSISGPWHRQQRDVNCRADVPICAGMPAEGPLAKERPTGQLTINAQGIGLSVLPLASGDNVYLWHGSRWLSAPEHPPQCPSLCQPAVGPCTQPAGYIKGHDYDYWIPLQFDEVTGMVQQFDEFVDSFVLELP